MNRKLVHYRHSIQPGGGAPGYLYNLREVQDEHAAFQVVFKHEIKKRSSQKGNVYERLSRLMLPNSMKALIHYSYIYLNLCGQLNLNREDIDILKDDSHIVFHSIFDLVIYLKSKFYSKKTNIYFMSHAPTTISEELCEYVAGLYQTKVFYPFFLKKFSQQELSLYQQTKGHIIPCKNAADAYFRYDKEMKNDFDKTIFHFLITGRQALEPKKSRATVRRLLNISDKEIAVCFVGRYNEHKGFDIYNNIVASFYENSERKDICFFSAGSGNIEASASVDNLGFRSDIADVVSAMDVMINCNRVAYFDLSIIEAISLKKMIIMSNSGGNKCFIELLNSKDYAFDLSNTEAIIAILNQIKHTETENIGNRNYAVFLEHFSSGQFYKNHQKVAENILKENTNRA